MSVADFESELRNWGHKPYGEYDKFTKSLARYPEKQEDPEIVGAMYEALGLVGEAGEVSEKVKKWHRDGVLDKLAVAMELGDVLYYLTRVANRMGYSLEDIQGLNQAKLTSRKKRGTIHGSGDSR